MLPGRNVAGQQSYRSDEKNHRSKRYRGQLALCEEQRGDGLGEQQRRDGACRNADEGEAESLGNDAALHLRHGCAEGHADADFLSALSDGVADDAVDAERHQQDAERGEGGHQKHEELARKSWRG